MYIRLQPGEQYSGVEASWAAAESGSVHKAGHISTQQGTVTRRSGAAAPPGWAQSSTQDLISLQDVFMSRPAQPAANNAKTITASQAGFDPFDELASASRKPTSSGTNSKHTAPALAPDSSHGPLALDPLSALWQQDSEPLPARQQPNGSSIQRAATSGFDPWSLDDLAGPSQPSSQRSHRATPDALPKASHSNSMGDLLQLEDDSAWQVSQGSGNHLHPKSLTGPGSSTPNSRTNTPDLKRLQDGNENGSDVQLQDRGNQQQGEGNNMGDQRELFIYAIPLSKEKLVFLPIRGWQEEAKAAPTGVTGAMSAGITKLQDNVKNMWTNMGNKDPGTFQHRIYTHGQAVLENMSAEERLMRYIPKAASKVVVYHPAAFSPQEVQDQLQKMTQNFQLKATGKAAAAGVLLPLAVGIEMIAVPGTGWFALYQLYKASVSAKGVQRLNAYLHHAKNVRVCYAGLEKLDIYVERSRLSPDGLLTQDDIDDLCHDLEVPGLQHPLSELRNRYLKRVQTTGEYALLPANDAADADLQHMGSGSSGSGSGSQTSPNGWGFMSQLAFWK